jgi:hypothetical protein
MTRMKLLLLAGTALLGLAASEPAAHAQRVNFTYTGRLVTYTVPKTGIYQILALGAQGGSGRSPIDTIGAGGLGAEIGGEFSLTAGEILQIAVGGAGGDNPVLGVGVVAAAASWLALVTRRWSSPVAAAAVAAPARAVSPARTAGRVSLITVLVMAAPAATVVALALTSSGEVAAAGFSALAARLLAAVAVVVRFQTSPAATTEWTVASVAAVPGASAAAVAAAIAVVVLAALGLLVAVAVAAPSTRARTRSWSPISRPETARS